TVRRGCTMRPRGAAARRARARPLLTTALLVALAGPVAVPLPAPPDDPNGPAITLTSYTDAVPPQSALDVLFVGEGYAGAAGQRKFKKDLERYGKRLLETAPFSWYRKR